jgi:hypothetical protein
MKERLLRVRLMSGIVADPCPRGIAHDFVCTRERCKPEQDRPSERGVRRNLHCLNRLTDRMTRRVAGKM